MRAADRIGAALTAALLETETPPPPSTLVGIVAEAIGATRCELRLGAKSLSWSARGARADDDAATLVLGANPDVVAIVAPADAMPAPEAWQPLLLLLTPYAAEDATWHARRRQQEAVARIDDARWRASADMEHERRRLERDLHDGAQHHLVALRMSIALADHRRLEPDGEVRLAALRAQLDAAESLLVATARGVLPKALATSGLQGALQALAGPGVVVRADIPRLMPAVESALYYAALEAVSNARKHAGGARIAVEARLDAGRARVEVRDDGPGFDAGGEVGGLAHLAERIEAIGGALEVRSTPGAGTRVVASAPY
ncbi:MULTISPECIES: sensor histidine kinase [unclassified Agrococcus]|uniref:sensor histidine kinase n=1 Tax=unclassified Agrococcus TaxID=2615065 RepID=UPI0036066B04